MNPWVLTLGGLVLFLAGLGLGYLMSRRPGDRQAAEELAVVKEDFEAYREGVTRHFRDSAGHFQAIGEQYRALYSHMADGAKNFCAGGPEQEAIEFAPQPELLPRDAGPVGEPVTAAAVTTALSEDAKTEANEEAEAEVAERREPTVGPEETEPAVAAGEGDENPDAGTDESGDRVPSGADSDQTELQESPDSPQVQETERKETQPPGSGMVH